MEVKNQKLKRGRLSKAPLAILLLLCLAILAVAFFSVSPDNTPAKNETQAGRSDLLADARAQIEKLQAENERQKQKNQVVPPVEQKEPAAQTLSPTQALLRYERLQAEPQRAEPKPPTPEEQLLAKRRQAFSAALTASSAVALNFGATSFSRGTAVSGQTDLGLTSSQGALTPAQRQRLAEQKQQLSGLKGSGQLAAYDALDTGSDHALPYRVEGVDTPFIIRQGAQIPAVLLSGINSDIPGQVLAQTTQAVYDSPRGNFELIPQGSRLVGQYLSQPAYGSKRIMLAFNRIIFPDGKSLTLGAMPAASPDGYAGLEADVDNHMFHLLSGALLLGGITAMVAVTQDEAYDEDGNLTASSALTQAVGASLGQVLADVVERNISIAPTLEVEPGFCFNLTLLKDLRFDGPYQGFDYAS